MICGVLTTLYSNWQSLHHLDTGLEFHLQIDVKNLFSYLDLGC